MSFSGTRSRGGDEFTSVLGSSSSSSGPSVGVVGRELPKTQLSEQQLFDRIQEQLEQLDNKRLTLQQLVTHTQAQAQA